ncbi:hypothetical protein F5148DRAFT_1173068 [Russula earlei]|uniref:Uncharacterized protein n=1 Tax=Russula earlei TaxID=71964 RepID=A0ACC0UHF1_9AGAM|nr:hypothetical protein F5148DRAFT_1173068 [Russula earlei]
MRTCSVFAIFCIAVGVAPSLALPPRSDPSTFDDSTGRTFLHADFPGWLSLRRARRDRYAPASSDSAGPSHGEGSVGSPWLQGELSPGEWQRQILEEKKALAARLLEMERQRGRSKNEKP